MLFGTNNVTNHKKENAKRERMQGEFTTRMIPLRSQRILRQWHGRERDTGENTESKEQSLPNFCAKMNTLIIKKREQITDNPEKTALQKSRGRHRKMRTKVLQNQLRNSGIQKHACKHTRISSRWHQFKK